MQSQYYHLSIFTDINECGYSNGNCSHKCVNMAGTYRCECPPEYTLLSNKHDCLKGEYLILLETAMHSICFWGNMYRKAEK